MNEYILEYVLNKRKKKRKKKKHCFIICTYCVCLYNKFLLNDVFRNKIIKKY